MEPSDKTDKSPGVRSDSPVRSKFLQGPMTLTADRLRELLHYEPSTGVFTWAVSRHGVRAGMVAGSLDSDGYRKLSVDGRFYGGHRLAWLWLTGEWPLEIDHKNGKRDDNRACNLRAADRAVNTQNRQVARSDSSTGRIGVSPSGQKFQANIKVKGKRTYLGVFATPDLAHAAYLEAKSRLHTAV